MEAAIEKASVPERVAVVVPVLNEAGRSPGLVADLAAQEPPAAEIVVVDAGSADGTSQLLRSAPGYPPVSGSSSPRRDPGPRPERGRPRLDGGRDRRHARCRQPRGPGFVAALAAAVAQDAAVAVGVSEPEADTGVRARRRLVHAQCVQTAGAARGRSPASISPPAGTASPSRARRGRLSAAIRRACPGERTRSSCSACGRPGVRWRSCRSRRPLAAAALAARDLHGSTATTAAATRSPASTARTSSSPSGVYLASAPPWPCSSRSARAPPAPSSSQESAGYLALSSWPRAARSAGTPRSPGSRRSGWSWTSRRCTASRTACCAGGAIVATALTGDQDFPAFGRSSWSWTTGRSGALARYSACAPVRATLSAVAAGLAALVLAHPAQAAEVGVVADVTWGQPRADVDREIELLRTPAFAGSAPTSTGLASSPTARARSTRAPRRVRLRGREGARGRAFRC